MAAEPRPTHAPARPVIHDADPVDRVQQEVALWASPRMKDIFAIIRRAALVDVVVLITGETGTGKELVARALHYLGARRNGPFVKVNCSAVARELLESELFGHERGAFTGAHQLKIGKLEAAFGGTVFLDEIGELHPILQAKLLHVLEAGQFSRVGGRSAITADARIVLATNRDLEASVAAGTFRQDLFYRLNTIRIAVPPLRKRPEDVAPLIHYFVERYARLFEREGFTVPPETLQSLKQQRFPGNVRELENLIKRMIVLHDVDTAALARGNAMGPSADRRRPRRTEKAPGSLREVSRKAAQAAEQSAILKALQETRWNRLRAAKLLHISYRSLLYKIKEAGLDGKPKD
jgi:transcriptional regulator with PAS, ATPase and Fis domain